MEMSLPTNQHHYLKYDVMQSICNIVARCPVNMTEEDMFDCLKIKRRFPINIKGADWNCPSLEVISQWGKLTHEVFDADGYLIFDEWKKYHDMGFSSIISHALDLTSELRYLDEELKKITGRPNYANLYFSRGSSDHAISFPHHNHNYEVVVKPIYGKYTWRINDEYMENENKVIHLPKGTNHSVVDCPGPKLSLTLNFHDPVGFNDGSEIK
jgi:hypothetical protein|tara:strand:- start:69 stop:704 length:636 start_codon:yes stop_codon:yes gene_type:complete